MEKVDLITHPTPRRETVGMKLRSELNTSFDPMIVYNNKEKMYETMINSDRSSTGGNNEAHRHHLKLNKKDTFEKRLEMKKIKK